MVRKVETIVTLIDDLDGTRAESTISFAFKGTHYEIDLSAKNSKKFSDLIGPFIGAARKATRAPQSRRSSGAASGRRDITHSKAIRQWARSNGWPDISDRGRIPAEIEAAYNGAH
jgi:hypothetical protein